MISLFRSGVVGSICTRSISYAHLQSIKEAQMVHKMVKKSLGRKKVVSTKPRKLKQEVLASAYDNEATNRKTAALNKLYMEQLIELINLGPLGSRITELGIEISKIKITHCRSSINIYWVSKKPGISEEPEVAEALMDLKKELQTQIGFVKYMRKIPFISFVKDLRLERENNVEKLLKVADFGKDVKPINPRRVVKPDSNELLKLTNSENLEMRQNILGIDHAKIKENIMQDMKRFQAVNIKKNEIVEVGQYEHPGKLVVFNKKLFNSFYYRKLYLDKKLRKREYGDSYVQLDGAYDPEEEANKHWDFHKFNDLILEEEEQILQDYENLYGDDTGKGNDHNDYDFCEDTDDYKKKDNSGKELGKEKFSEEKNK